MVLKLYVLLGHHTKLTHTNFVTKYVIFCELWGKMSVPDIKNLGLVFAKYVLKQLTTSKMISSSYSFKTRLKCGLARISMGNSTSEPLEVVIR